MTEPKTSDSSQKTIRDIAAKHGFGEDAATVMAEAVAAGGGSMAQFNHPDFGGMGQWSRGGMLMIGDMFNNALKARVGALADDLAEAMTAGRLAVAREDDTRGAAQWWPRELGQPSSSGSQNGQDYAVFPNLRRLAVNRNGQVTVHDTGDHRIQGASQQQGSGSSLGFSSQSGPVRLEDLPTVHEQSSGQRSPAPEQGGETRGPAGDGGKPADNVPSATAPGGHSDVIETIRKLAELRDQGILTEEEFGARKRTLLDRL